MAKPKIGAKVKYCNHDGTFVADIHMIGNVNVVRANGPVTPGNLIRPAGDDLRQAFSNGWATIKKIDNGPDKSISV